jgi:hypothetical protein
MDVRMYAGLAQAMRHLHEYLDAQQNGRSLSLEKETEDESKDRTAAVLNAKTSCLCSTWS